MGEAGRYQLSGNAAHTYERDLVGIFNRPLAETTFGHVTLHEGERVLDTACGTGIVTRVALERFKGLKKIVGVDLNTGMLDVAREHTPATETVVEWHEGDICAWPFPDASFDVVICQQGLQYIPDKLAALRDMRRVLVSGGRLALTVWQESNRQAAAMTEALRRQLGPDVITQLGGSAWNDAETLRRSSLKRAGKLSHWTLLPSRSVCLPQGTSREDKSTGLSDERSLMRRSKKPGERLRRICSLFWKPTAWGMNS